MTITIVLAITLFAFSTQAATPTDEKPIITLQPVAEIEGDTVMLSDLFLGLAPEQDKPLAAAPEPGKQRVYHVLTLARLAKANRLAWRAATMSDQVLVKRRAQSLDARTVETILMNALKEKDAGDDITLHMDQRVADVLLPAGDAPQLTLNSLNYD
ncbi:MAG: hypothetical protein EBZ69_10215, partial [Alphaproteobacteria bacterium]|nr:hypothetical protein [Alphaproteobacteria bacterium]